MTTKTEAAQAIYQELKEANDPEIRKKFIARAKAELSMSDSGAATYYQNAKKKAEGGEVKAYGKTARSQAARSASAEVNTDPWSVIQVIDERIADCIPFIGEQAARDAYEKLNPHNKEVCEVIQGTLPVDTPYVIGG